MHMITLSDIHSARARLQGISTRTRLIEFSPRVPHACPEPSRRVSPPLRDVGTLTDPSRRLFLKPENQQPIGAFKLRGAYNKIASLSEADRKRGVISYSSGNHAQGVAYAARALGVKAVIVMPNNAPAIKREATAALGAEIVLVGPGSAERQLKAEELAARHGYVIVPPYNDEKIIAGQGTIGLEILEDLPEVEAVFAPVGGGGLISGVAAAIKLTRPEVQVIGVEPELASDAQASLRAGKIVQFPPDQVSRTIADGLRTQSVGDINFDHMQCFVDAIVTVSEDEIHQAVKLLSANPETIAEPSGAVATAGFLFRSDQLPKTKLNVAIISGGNVEPKMLEDLRQR
jgi:threonine dehydratase